MKCTMTRQDLLTAIHTVEGAVAAKSTLPILMNILIEVTPSMISLHATDLELGISIKMPVTHTEIGAITVPAKRLADIVKELPEGEIQLSVKKNFNLFIDCPQCSFRLIGLPKEEFPTMPQYSDEEYITLAQPTVKKLLRMVSFAMSRDETRYVLNGVLVYCKGDKLRFVATDGRRLALSEAPIRAIDEEKKLEIIIPTKTVVELQKALKDEGTLSLRIINNQVAVSIGQVTLLSRLIEGEFPPYEQILPKERTKEYNDKVHLKKDEFLAAIRRAHLLTSGDSQSIKFDVFKNKIIISKVTADIGEHKEELKMAYAGPEITVGFNSGFLIDVLKVLQNEEINLELIDEEKPGVFRESIDSEKGNYVYMVLPMQYV